MELEYVEDTVAENLLLERVRNEKIISNEKPYLELFDYLIYEEKGSGVIFTEEIIPLLLLFVDYSYYHVDENEFNLEIADLFLLKGKLVSGYYDELVLRDVELINGFTEQLIKSYDSKYLGGTMEILEDELGKDMMNSYLETLSSYDAVQIGREIMEEK